MGFTQLWKPNSYIYLNYKNAKEIVFLWLKITGSSIIPSTPHCINNVSRSCYCLIGGGGSDFSGKKLSILFCRVIFSFI